MLYLEDYLESEYDWRRKRFLLGAAAGGWLVLLTDEQGKMDEVAAVNVLHLSHWGGGVRSLRMWREDLKF